MQDMRDGLEITRLQRLDIEVENPHEVVSLWIELVTHRCLLPGAFSVFHSTPGAGGQALCAGASAQPRWLFPIDSPEPRGQNLQDKLVAELPDLSPIRERGGHAPARRFQ